MKVSGVGKDFLRCDCMLVEGRKQDEQEEFIKLYLNKDKHKNISNCIINQPFILAALRSQGFLSQLFMDMLGRLKTLLLQLSSFNHHP